MMPGRVTMLSYGRWGVAGPLAAVVIAVAGGVPGSSVTVPTGALTLASAEPAFRTVVARVSALSFAPATIRAARAATVVFPAGAPGTVVPVDVGTLSVQGAAPDVSGGQGFTGDASRRVRVQRDAPIMAEVLFAIGEDAMATAVLILADEEEVFG